MMQYHFKRYYIVDIKCSTSDIIVLSQKAVFTVFEISEKLRVQKVQHVIYFACKCELNSFKWIKDMKWMWICDPNCIVQETGRIRAENEHHTLGFQLFTKETHTNIHHMALLWSKNHGYPYHSHIRSPVCLDDMGIGNIRWQYDWWYGNGMGSCQVYIISIVESQETCGIGMGLSHIIPMLFTMGNVWGATKYVAIP